MDESKLDLISRELSREGKPAAVTPEQEMLDGYRMTSQTDVPEEVFMLKFFSTPCFPRKEVTTVTGIAKSGKTFFTSMLMAECLTPYPAPTGEGRDVTGSTEKPVQKVLPLKRVDEEQLRVMWYDTEQSRSTTKEIMVGRIGQMIGCGDCFPDDKLFVFNVRAASIQERRDLLAVAIETYKPDIVILDGISDLLTDINDGPRATELMEDLLHIADEHNCNITTIIHLNRSGEKSNLRGWLGSVMLQKSFEVFNCAKVEKTEVLSVEQTISRKWHCTETLYYDIDDRGIPYSTPKPDVQDRDDQGRYTSRKTDIADMLNRDYIIEHAERKDHPWEWDLKGLFIDAMGTLPYMGSEQMMQAVMQLSHIKQKQYYYKVLDEAERQGVIIKTFDRYKRVVIMLQPNR